MRYTNRCLPLPLPIAFGISFIANPYADIKVIRFCGPHLRLSAENNFR